MNRPALIASLFAVASGAVSQTPTDAARTLAIVGGTVIDGTGGPARPDTTVLIRGNRIVAVGTADIEVPETAHVLDATGRFVIPGLWDMHVHLSKVRRPALPLLLWHGVTSVRDMGGELAEIRDWQRQIESGTLPGPRVLTAGPYFEAAGNVQRMLRDNVVEPVERTRLGIDGPDAARREVARVAALGVDYIKIRTFASRETYFALAEAAAAAGLPLVGHVTGLSPEDILRSGQRNIEHGFYPPLADRPPQQRQELFAELARRGVALVPTLSALYDFVLASPDVVERAMADEDGAFHPWRPYVAAYALADWREQAAERTADAVAMYRSFAPGVLADTRDLRAAGMPILPGSDTAVLLIYPGAALHDELEMFVDRLGMTAMEALVSATRQPAEFLGLQLDLGTIAPSKLADLLILDDDPLADIRNTRTLHTVVKNGEVFGIQERQRMLEMVRDMPELELNDWHNERKRGR